MAMAAPPAPSTFTARGMRTREVVVNERFITYGDTVIPVASIRIVTMRRPWFRHSALLVLRRYRDLTPGLRFQRLVVKIRLSRADAEAALRRIQRFDAAG
jgi:hypothetical protein